MCRARNNTESRPRSTLPRDPTHPTRATSSSGYCAAPTSGLGTSRALIGANAEWLTVFQLPTYAPDLNPHEGVCSLVKRDIGNLAAADLGQITRAVKRKLKMPQYRPEVIDGCLAGTSLAL